MTTVFTFEKMRKLNNKNGLLKNPAFDCNNPTGQEKFTLEELNFLKDKNISPHDWLQGNSPIIDLFTVPNFEELRKLDQYKLE